VPMLRNLSRDAHVAEIHVMVAPLWRNTGVDGHQLAPLGGVDKLHWHIIDQAPPAAFRVQAHDIPGLADTIDAIAPDLTLARSADFETPARFPGIVRYIMEGAASPFVTDPAWVVLEEQPFAYGAMPADVGLIAACRAFVAPLWQQARAGVMTRDAARAGLGLPADGKVLAVPLQYEHGENLYLNHAAYPDSVALLQALLDRVPGDVLLAVSDHPLNRLYVDRSALERFIASHADRIRLVVGNDVTVRLIYAADAVLSDLSKTWSQAAFAGRALVHVGRYRMADWLNGTDLSAIGQAGLPTPDAEAARGWFSWHLAGRLLRPEAVDAPLLLRHATQHIVHADLAANCAALTALIAEAA